MKPKFIRFWPLLLITVIVIVALTLFVGGKVRLALPCLQLDVASDSPSP